MKRKKFDYSGLNELKHYEDDACMLVNPLFAMANSRAYQDEHKKVID